MNEGNNQNDEGFQVERYVQQNDVPANVFAEQMNLEDNKKDEWFRYVGMDSPNRLYEIYWEEGYQNYRENFHSSPREGRGN